ncbi:MAG: hypothetical protein HY048_09640 [Acidobacteria bacterium]|nr:hypothetical protein [Acidobacteriota bacterium]
MEEPTDPAVATGNDKSNRETTAAAWTFRIALTVGALAIGYLLLGHGIAVFAGITDRLPLLLPLAVTVMSIFTRATDIRSYEAVLKTSNDITIGIISFDIWLLSARNEATGRVLVNPTTMIRGEFAIAFLVFGLLIAVGSLILIHYEFRTARERQRALLVGFVASVLIYIAPFGVLEPVPPPAPPGPTTVALKHFAVAIPYADPGITGIAPSILEKRFLVHFERDVEAPTRESAQATAVQRFLATDESNQVRTKKGARTGDKVNIAQKEILVAER